MKRMMTVGMLALIAMAGTALAQDKTTTTKQPAIKSNSQPKTEGLPGTPEGQQWMDSVKLAPEHEHLKPMIGTWNAEVSIFAAPGAEPTKSNGTMVTTGTFNGRYLTSTFTSEMGGQPFQGISTWAYNKERHQFENTWIDNMSTNISFATGTFDAASKKFTLVGKMYDPMMKQEVTQKQVTTINSDTKMTFEMFTVTSDGKEIKNMQIIYTKKADAKTSAQPK